MSRHLIISPGAEDDIQDAFGWYEERQDELGRRFIGELDLAFDRIVAEPHSYQEDFPGIRRSILHVFPYLIFYALP